MGRKRPLSSSLPLPSSSSSSSSFRRSHVSGFYCCLFVVVAFWLACLISLSEAAVTIVLQTQLAPIENVTITASEATFGTYVNKTGISAVMVPVIPETACSNITIPSNMNVTGKPWIALITRGECDFERKVHLSQLAGASMAIIHNNNSGQLLTMTAFEDGSQIEIPALFITKEDGLLLREEIKNVLPDLLEVLVFALTDVSFGSLTSHWAMILFVGILSILIICFLILLFMIYEIYRHRRRHRAQEPKPVISAEVLTSLPSKVATEEDIAANPDNITCSICLDDFEVGCTIRILPCGHEYHQSCVDPWLLKHTRLCPICKRDITNPTGKSEDENTPSDAVVIEMQNLNTMESPLEVADDEAPNNGDPSSNLEVAIEVVEDGVDTSANNNKKKKKKGKKNKSDKDVASSSSSSRYKSNETGEEEEDDIDDLPRKVASNGSSSSTEFLTEVSLDDVPK